MLSSSRCLVHLTLLAALLISITFSASDTADSPVRDYRLRAGADADTWVLTVKNTMDYEEVKRLAAEHNFELKQTVGSLDGHYILRSLHHTINRRSTDQSTSKSHLVETIKRDTAQLNDHKLVNSFHREKVVIRKKRDFTGFNRMRQHHLRRNAQPVSRAVTWPGEDPMWKDTWYLNRHEDNSELPDMNVTGVWAQGITGKGVSVTFLDDGLEWDHPDIKQNYDPKASYDMNDHDDDPMPRYDPTNENKHGTRCAGQVAAVANNSVCSVGVAYNAGIGGIRMLDGDVTDSTEAGSLSHNIQDIDIYSASWGPDDNGEVVDGPGPLARKAFINGVNRGRNGLGSIYVWASGNGGRYNDSCACDGYANSIYTMSISSTSELGDRPWYLEECASTLATTYSSGDTRKGEREVYTTDIHHKCTGKHTGTSAAAPLAAGIIALTLEANPKLTWRDIMFLTVISARPKAIKSNNYIANKRGLLFSSAYGFGLMDAGRMVALAKNWTNVPEMISCSILNSKFRIDTISQSNSVEATLNTDACRNTDNEVNFIEQIEIIVSVTAFSRGKLQIYLTSPMGTRTQILPKRSRDFSSDGFKRWAFMSVQLWGEFPRGDWKLQVKSDDHTQLLLEEYMLIIHGTKGKPIDYSSVMSSSAIDCNYECSHLVQPCGPTQYNCSACAHFSMQTDSNSIKCVSYCPIGYYADVDVNKCFKCDKSCLDCWGPSSKACRSCTEPAMLKLDTNECVNSCDAQNGYFINFLNACDSCAGECAICSKEKTLCQKCVSIPTELDSTFVELTLKNDMCVPRANKECEKGRFYNDTERNCQPCDSTCAECAEGSAESCLACPSESYLQENRCVKACDDGFYLDETLKRCLRCNYKCATCREYSVCTTMTMLGPMIDEYFYDDMCHDINCYECFGKMKGQCRVCKDEMPVFNGECLSGAMEGHFKKKIEDHRGIKYEMIKCPSNCLLCSDETHCDHCEKNFTPKPHLCYPTCPPKHFPNLDGTCIACKSPCGSCSNETQCETCEAGMFLLNGKCLAKCPHEFFTNDGKTCSSCFPSCKTCTGPSENECNSCNEGFNPTANNPTKCTSQCSETNYYDKLKGQCSKCNPNTCHFCIKTAETCTKCLEPMVLDQKTSTCKRCCARSVSIGKDATPCCNCPGTYTGSCMAMNQTEAQIEFNSSSLVRFSSTFILLLVIFVFIFFLSSVAYFLRSVKKNSTEHANVRYSQLNDIHNSQHELLE